MDLDRGAWPLDREDFLGAIQAKARLVADGHAAGASAATPGLKADGLLFAGMGFSGVSANLVKDAATRALETPFSIVKHYQFPHHVKQNWLTMAVSYSGQTEETVAVARESKARGVRSVAFTTGGQLANICDQVVEQPIGFQPRAAFAFTWFSILGFLERSGLLNESVPVGAAIEAIEAVDAACGPDVDTDQNEAKQLARQLHELIPQIYATPAFYGVGLHFRGMLNENAKKIADVDLVPECNHNDLTGWGGDPNRRHFTCLALSHAEQNEEIRKRLDFMAAKYESWQVPWHHKQFSPIHSFAEHVVEQARAIQFLDYTSFYVAMLRGVDPSEIQDIVDLKARLRA